MSVTYPKWETPEGSFGKIVELEYYSIQLSAIDPYGVNNINYEIISGQLPPGIQLAQSGLIAGGPETLTGTPKETNVDRDYKFVIRATIEGYPSYLTDRTFSLTVGGNRAPQILTPGVSLGTFLDGTEINLQVIALDLDNDPIEWNIVEGSLPPGLTLNQDGSITGVVVPYVQLPNDAGTGWDNSAWENFPWEFRTRSATKNYQFTIEVNDGKEFVSREYTILILSHSNLSADNDLIYADTDRVRASNDEIRPPIIISDDLGDYATFKSDNYFAFKFDAVDYDGDAIEWTILVDGLIGFDATGSNFDMALFDKGSFNLPSGLVMNSATGWLSGYLPAQVESSREYTFAIQAYKKDDPTYITPPKLFTLTVLGSLSLDINWITDSDLGVAYAGEVSELVIEAESFSGQELQYSLKNGSRLPTGTKLISDGNISGRISFQTFSLDGGSTTFDQSYVNKLLLDAETLFDRTYTFTIVATNAARTMESEKEFYVKIENITYEPYENVYLRCMPKINARDKYIQIVENTDIIPTDSLYRPNDPYWGRQKNIQILSAYGLTASNASDYIAAMQDRHYNKTFYFGNYGRSLAKDKEDNDIYEVIWVEIIDPARSYRNNIKQNPARKDFNVKDYIYGWENPRGSDLDIVANNDEYYMRRDLIENIGRTNPATLPAWMTSVQEDKSISGFVTRAPIAYVKVGEGKKVLFRINRAVKNKTIPNIQEIPFVADRYILDSHLSTNFNIEEQKFNQRYYTTFDNELSIINTLPSGTVDFAVEIPFELINGKTIDQLYELGGLDNIATSYVDKTLVFAQQENYTGYTYNEEYNGWIKYNTFFDDVNNFDSEDYDAQEIIPGYVEAGASTTIINQRAGIWRFTYDNNNLIKLVFVEEIELGTILTVNYGEKYGGNLIKYDPASIAETGFVPKYTIVDIGLPTEQPPTTFDSNSTKFVTRVDSYSLPNQGDKYLKFPKIGVFN